MNPRKRENHSVHFIIIAVAVALTTVPFISQAYSMDDPFTIWTGRALLHQGFDFLNAESFWHDRPSTLFREFRNPPLISVVSAGIISLGLGSRVGFHLAMAFILYLTSAAFYQLSRSIPLSKPLHATLLFMFTPVVMVQSHHIMPDLLSLGCFLGGTVLLINAINSNSLKSALVAGVMGGLAGLTKYSALMWMPLMIPLVPYTQPARRKEALKKVLLAVTVAAVLNGAWQVFSLIQYGTFHGVAVFTAIPSVWSELYERIIALICHLGGTLLFPGVLLIKGRPRTACFNRSLGAALLLCLLAFNVRYNELPVISRILGNLFIMWGLPVIWGVFFSNRGCTQRSSNLDYTKSTISLVPWLKLWFAASLAATLLGTPFFANRYLLLSVPPLILYAMYCYETSATSRQNRAWQFYWLILGASLMLASALSTTSFELAQSQETLAGKCMQYAESHTDPRTNSVPYFTGHWGFHYYLQESGAKPLPAEGFLPKGIFIFRGINLGEQPFPQVLEKVSSLESVQAEPLTFPITILNRECGAGFYIHYDAPLPWTICLEQKIEVEIREILLPIHYSAS